ncbi:MAG: LAGLIDADG family homing endonuclease [Nanoarchaeota archaeon]
MKLDFPKDISEELAEETGWHIGDGSMNYYDNGRMTRGIYQLRGHIEDDKDHYITRIKPIFKRLYNVDLSLREMPSTRVFGFQIWNNDLVDFKKKLGLPLGKKFHVDIPEVFLKNKKLTSGVIRGIFDTDGCLYLPKKNGKLYPRLEISTISLKLAEQLKSAYLNLGLRAALHEVRLRNPGNRMRSYKIVINGVEMLHKFMEVISPKNSKHLAKYYFFKQSFK